MEPWTADQVEALAPDAASVTAGRKVAGAGWAATGQGDDALWGLARGSGASPYVTCVDLHEAGAPAYRCSCPSRKFPCKHALGLLLRWARGEVEPGEPPDDAQDWLTSRRGRGERIVERVQAAAVRAAKPPDERAVAAAAKRAAQRRDHVTSGLAELDRWLADQVRSGVAGLRSDPYAAFEPMAARLTDAQAPGVAAWLRGLPGLVVGGPDWPERLLEELALLRLLVRAHVRLDEIEAAEPALAASIRTHVGYPVSKESVLALPGVRDRWAVQGRRDSAVAQLSQRTVWLQGEQTGRMATVLAFAPPGQQLDASLVPGRVVAGDLHFYPAARPLRALVSSDALDGGRHGPPHAGFVGDALAAVADALAADPWTRSVPAWVVGTPVRHTSGGRDGWAVRDELGDALLLRPGGDLWGLVATAGGRPAALLLEWRPGGWAPVTAATTWQETASPATTGAGR